MTTAETDSPRRGGRPSRADAERLGERILEIATELFLRDGYGSTSIEAVAQAAGTAKRTLYARYAGKPELFAAVVARIIDQIRPPPDVPLLVGTTAAEILERLGWLMLRASLAPSALALHRLMISESGRFPELVAGLNGEGGGRHEAIRLISSVIENHPDGPRLSHDTALFAAGQFIEMIVAWPQRLAMGYGTPLTPDEERDWARRTARLFLSGCAGLGA